MLRLGLGDDAIRAKAQKELDKKYPEALQNKQQYDQIYQMVGNADKAITKELGTDKYSKEDLAKIDPKTEEMRQHIAVLTQMYQYSDDMRAFIKDLKKG